MQFIANVAPLVVFGFLIYGLTRDRVSQPWGRWLSGCCAAVLLFVLVSAPDDGCYVDWDGRSNPEVCD